MRWSNSNETIHLGSMKNENYLIINWWIWISPYTVISIDIQLFHGGYAWHEWEKLIVGFDISGYVIVWFYSETCTHVLMYEDREAVIVSKTKKETHTYEERKRKRGPWLLCTPVYMRFIILIMDLHTYIVYIWWNAWEYSTNNRSNA